MITQNYKSNLFKIVLRWNHNDFLFVCLMWLLSRLVIVIGIQLISPSLHFDPVSFNESGINTLQIKNFVPQPGWELFTHWDGEHYRNIATKGYEYLADRRQNNIAFFPIYPLAIWLLLLIGIPFDIAAILLSNTAFLVALLVFYKWIDRQYNQAVAKWSTAVMAWFPLSLFCSLAYTESFFLLFTIVTLSNFENKQYTWATIFGILATATRSPGLVLIPTFLMISWLERRPLIAYLSALAMGGGIIAFSLFCWIRFDQPLAFVLAQSGWPQPSWLEFCRDILLPLFRNDISIYFYVVTVALTAITSTLIFRYSRQGYVALGVPVLTGIPSLLPIIMSLTSVWLIWCCRRRLKYIPLVYGYCSLAFLFLSGTKMSIHRYIYAIAPMSLALGILLDDHPRSGYVVMGSFGCLLLYYSVRFAWWDWVA
jgi:Gpi18-like mannosyltransferase